MQGYAFNAAQVAPQVLMGAIEPEGWYPVVLSKATIDPTKDGAGVRINCEFTIMEGPNAKRIIFEGYNIQNENPQTVEIARKQYSALHHAIGIMTTNTPMELANRPFRIRIKTKAEEGREPQSRVTGYAGINDTQHVYAWLKATATKPAPGSVAAPAVAPQTWPAPAQPAQPAQPPQAQFAQPVAAPAQFVPPAAPAPVAAPVAAAAGVWQPPANPQPWEQHVQPAQVPQAPQAPQAPQGWAPPAGAVMPPAPVADPNAVAQAYQTQPAQMMPAQPAVYPGMQSTPNMATPVQSPAPTAAPIQTAGETLPPWLAQQAHQ
jgi:hypothetical protein